MSEVYGIMVREKKRLEGEVADLLARLTAKQEALVKVSDILSTLEPPEGGVDTSDTNAETDADTATKPLPGARYPQVREGSGMWKTIELLKQHPEGLSNAQIAEKLDLTYPYARNVASALAHEYNVTKKVRRVTSAGSVEVNIWVGV